MTSRKKITSSEAASACSTEIIQQYLYDSDSDLSSLSEDSSSEESDDCLHCTLFTLYFTLHHFYIVALSMNLLPNI